MSTHPAFDKAPAYLQVQLDDSRPSFDSRQADGPYITISREAGAGGTSLARMVVDRLNQESPEAQRWAVFSGNLMDFMIESNHLDPGLRRFLPEDNIPEINATIGELVGLHPNIWELVERTNEGIRKLARSGHVVLVGRGANFACAGIANGVHLRVVAPAPWRAQSVSRDHKMTDAEAIAYNLEKDAARARYVRKTFDADVRDPKAYDLILNTGLLTFQEAVGLVCDLAQIRFKVLQHCA